MAALSRIRGARVLLVEDNEINRQVAGEILEAAGLSVSLASNGQEAVEIVRKDDFHAILMDVQMPVMDGYTATREIRGWEEECRDSESPIPIIAMTAHALAGDREKSLEAGMNDHVSKPIDPELLFETLLKWVRKIPGEGINETGPAAVEMAIPSSFDEPDFPALDGIHVAEGLKRLLGNKASYLRILIRFAREFENAADSLRDLVNREEYEAAEILAHSIKGASGNIGAESLQAAAAALEKAIRDHRVLPKADVVHFKKALDRVLTALEVLKVDDASSPDVKGLSTGIDPQAALVFAERIRDAAEMGDVTELSQVGAELMDRVDGLKEYGTKITRLADEFDFDALLEMADDLADPVGSPGA